MEEDAKRSTIADRFQKILGLISTGSLLALFIMLASSSTAQGYELSLYDTFNPFFFLVFFISFISSTIGLFQAVKREKIDTLTLIFIFSIFLLLLTLIFLPYFREYTFYGRHDGLSHIGMIQDVLKFGYLGTDNFYPVLHIFSSASLLVTGIQSVYLVREFIMPVFYLMYITGVLVITKRITKNRVYGIFGILFASIPVLGLGSFTTSNILFLMLPFILYLFYLNVHIHSLPTKIIFILSILFVPFMHPEIVMFLLGVFILFYILSRINQVDFDKYASVSRNSVIIIGMSFFLWFIANSKLFQFVRKIYTSLFLNLGEAPIDTYSMLLSRSQLTFNEFALLVIKREGAIIIYLFLALIIILLFFKGKYRKNLDTNLILFGSIFCITILWMVTSLFFDIIVGYDRILKFSVFAAVIVISIFLIRYFKDFSYRKTLYPALFVVLLCSMILSTFCIYDSPHIETYNGQVSAMELSGANWLVQTGDRDIVPLQILFTFGRFVHAIEGFNYSMQKDYTYATVLYDQNVVIPDHFCYTNSSRFGEGMTEDKYVITNELMKRFYFELWPQHARFIPNDFTRVDKDPTVEKLYTNGEIDIRFVRAINPH
jgi:hypothetical protein